ncbi:unnamed protein product [Symbiodinium sp. CCMP2592]|nr:unnamed protein product [Symbiodinium sp. CCMP2592]
MRAVALCLAGLLVRSQSTEDAALPEDDECSSGQCAVDLLQKFQKAEYGEEWVQLIEGSTCPSGGSIPCEMRGSWRHFRFPAGVFAVPRQVSVPENTVIEGVANPNSNDPRTKPNYRSQTVFVANSGVSLLQFDDDGRGFGHFRVYGYGCACGCSFSGLVLL